MNHIRTIDSHTGGEPTRVVIDGGPDLGTGSLEQRVRRFTNEFDSFRTAIVNPPRGSEALVGALLCEPDDDRCTAAVIFFNNAGFLGMCGHGTIGLIGTLQYLSQIKPGRHHIQTPVGIVVADLTETGEVAVENVPSYRRLKDVTVGTRGLGTIHGDVAYGGNWFFLVADDAGPLNLARSNELTEQAREVRRALEASGVTGADGAVIDHIEFFSAPEDAANHSRNFVLCPNGAYDRSPCGTGTSAKLACLAADGQWAADQIWRQESVIGTVFDCSYRPAKEPNKIIPTIRGTAHITAESTLVLDPADPFCMGIRS